MASFSAVGASNASEVAIDTIRDPSMERSPRNATSRIRELLALLRGRPMQQERHATLLFGDIVGSTERIAVLGDRRWAELLNRYYSVVRTTLRAHGGREVNFLGDGFLATFDDPASAIRSAAAIREAVLALGLEMRAGVHTGSCERIAEGIAGMAVHIGARVAARAGAGEVLVSSAVKDMAGNENIQFVDRGIHLLKGVPGEWRLFLAQ